MYRQRVLLCHMRHAILRRRISRRCWLAPCNVRAHLGGLDKECEIARATGAEYTSWLTSQYVYLCPGESFLHSLRMTSRGRIQGGCDVCAPLLLQDSALWCCAAIYHLKTPQTSHFHALLMIAQRQKAAAVYGYKAAGSRNESHLGRVDWRYERWRPAGRLGWSRGRDGLRRSKQAR